MSIVTPIPQNTTIKAYAGVPWDNTLRDIRLFDTEAQRQTYFQTLLKGVWNNCSTVSIGKSIAVTAQYNNCLEINYLSFQNKVEGQTARTIYAYVTSVDYINVNTVRFTYEVDWIQTYLFEFVFEQCLVLREHVNDDTFGKNLVSEGIEAGDYTIISQSDATYNAAVAINVLKGDGYAATIQQNLYCPGLTYVYKLNDTTQIRLLNNLLNTYNTTPERITFLCMAVEKMQNPNGSYEAQRFMDSFSVTRPNAFKNDADSSGYIPQNKKMYSSPYMFITIDNYSGDLEQYKWEHCYGGTTFSYRIDGACIPKPMMRAYPYNYMGTSGTASGVKQMAVAYDNFPMLPYVTDTFKAWVSEYGRSYAVNQAASIVSGGFSVAQKVMRGDIIGAVSGGASTYNNYVQNEQTEISHKIHSLQLHGSIGQAGMSYADYTVGFRVTLYGIREERAKDIDLFFTRYGYEVDKVKVPNVRGRQYVNFVQCQGSRVGGNVAIDAKIQMERALDQGTSFWHINNMGGTLSTNPIVGA